MFNRYEHKKDSANQISGLKTKKPSFFRSWISFRFIVTYLSCFNTVSNSIIDKWEQAILKFLSCFWLVGIFSSVDILGVIFNALKTEKTKMEEKKKVEEQDVIRLVKEKEQINNEIWTLKQELETARKANEESCLRIENEGNKTQQELEERLKEVMHLLTESRSRVKELEAYSESKDERLNKKETIYQRFTDFQIGALRVWFCHITFFRYIAIFNVRSFLKFKKMVQELKIASQTIKQDTLKIQKSYSDEFLHLGG